MTAAALSASRRSCSLGSTPPPAGVVGAPAAVRAGRAPPPPSWLTPPAASAGSGSGRSIGSVFPTAHLRPGPSPLLTAGRVHRCPVPAKLAPESCCGASFLAPDAASACRSEWQYRHPAAQHRQQRPGGGATFPAHGCPGRCQEAGTCRFPWHGTTVGSRGKDLAEDRRDQGVVSFIGCYSTSDNRYYTRWPRKWDVPDRASTARNRAPKQPQARKRARFVT